MRRVSFAVALLQEPELLILDEPTVGVDPLLRERFELIYFLETNFIFPYELFWLLFLLIYLSFFVVVYRHLIYLHLFFRFLKKRREKIVFA